MSGWLCALALLSQSLSLPGVPPQADPPAAQGPAQTAAQASPEVKPSVPEAKPKSFKAALDKAQVTLGEPFTLTIEVTHPAADSYALPPRLKVGELTLRGAPSVQRAPGAAGSGEATTTFALPLADLRSLKPAVPDIALSVQGPAGARSFTVPGQPLELRSVVTGDGKGGEASKQEGPHGPKAPVAIYTRSYLWVGVLAGLGLFAAALWLAAHLGRRAKARRELLAMPKPLSAEDEALHRIGVLRARAPWARGEGRASIFELSEIVRVYLGRRLSFDAMDLTTDELLLALRQRRVLGLDLSELTEQLSWENLVKFAKVEPEADECLQALERAAELVDRMRPVEPPPDAAGAGREARA